MKDRQRLSILWFIPKIPATTEADLGQRGKLTILEPSLLLPRVCVSRKLDSGTELDLEPSHSDMGGGAPKWFLPCWAQCLP